MIFTALDVTLTTAETADFTNTISTSVTVPFADGAVCHDIVLDILDDELRELDEVFTI